MCDNSFCIIYVGIRNSFIKFTLLASSGMETKFYLHMVTGDESDDALFSVVIDEFLVK